MPHAMIYELLTKATGDERFFDDFNTNGAKHIIAQKLIYIFQACSELGEDAPWPYAWYHTGPFSLFFGEVLARNFREIRCFRVSGSRTARPRI